MNATPRHPFDFHLLPATLRPAPLLRTVERAARTALGLEQLRRCYDAVPARLDPEEFSRCILQELGISVRIEREEYLTAVGEGPLVIVANHPYGAAEGLALIDRLRRVRPDLRVLANDILSRIPELSPALIPVNPFGGSQAARENRSGVRAAFSWLAEGGALLIFPAGEVGHFRPGRGVVDPVWSLSAARLARRAGARVLPLWIDGGNGPLFHLSGLIHPRLRTALLPRQLLNKRGHTLRITVGRALPAGRLDGMKDDARATRYLREHVEMLGRREAPLPTPRRRVEQPIAPPVPPEVIERELAALTDRSLLLSHGSYDVYCAGAEEIPQTLREIGRLREITFRLAGEGTGSSRDIDRFDSHYRHLFLWHRSDREIVGAYRLGDVTAILDREGRGGLYTTTLFHIADALLQRLRGGLEMGRSFVQPRYQRQPHPLHLLWRGIGQIVLEGGHNLLFGPASISNDYTPESQRLLTSFLERHISPGDRTLVRAHIPLRNEQGVWEELGTVMEDVAEVVKDLEEERRGVPVLLRHYLRLGGRVLGFNRDRRFGDSIDCLMLVDLLRTDRAILETYMGEECVGSFLERVGMKNG